MKYEILRVETGHPMMDGTYIRPVGELEQVIRICPLAFANSEKAFAFGVRLATLMNEADL